MNGKAHAACNFNSLIEIGGLFNDTDSHIHCKMAIHRKRCKIDKRCYYRLNEII